MSVYAATYGSVYGEANMVATVAGYDVIAENIGTLPGGTLNVVAGYDTQAGGGTGYIAWSAADYAAVAARSRYAPLHIGQLPADDPSTCDYLDIEYGAATDTTLQQWAPGALEAFKAQKRPGQRQPAAYVEGSEVTPAVNALIAIGINEFPLILTEPMSQAAAQKILDNTSGPFPFVGVQYGFLGSYDIDLFSVAWLETGGNTAPPPPPVQWTEVSLSIQVPTISQAAPGPDPGYVQFMQGALNARAVGGGAVRLVCDGSFGPNTTNRLMQFQSNHGLAVDGVCGPLTWAALV